MRLRTLNALIGPAGVEPFTYGRGPSWEHLTPTTITREGDRGERTVETFRDEDELCRYLLLRSLAPRPPRPHARRHEPQLHRLPTADVAAPALRWRRGLPALTGLVGRGRGLAVLRDTTGLVDDPRRGASQVTVVDVATGEIRASWLPPHAICTALVVGTADDPVVLLAGEGRTEAFSVDGRPLWSFERPRWEPTIDAGPVVVLQQTMHRVDGTIREGGDAVGLDVRTGEEVWSRAAVSRPVFAFRGVPRLDRFFAWQVDGAHLRVLRIDLVTGGTRVLAETDLPAPLVGAGLTVLEDLMDAGCDTGHLTIRTAAHRPGVVGTLLGDLVVAAGDSVVRVLTEEPAALGHRSYRDLLSSSYVPGRVVRGSDEMRCTDLSGASIWSRPDRGVVRARASGVVLVETRGVVEAIAADGSTRWQRRGAVWVVAHDTVWIIDAGALSVLDPATGDVRWSGPSPWSADGRSARLQGASHPDDAMVLVADGSVLQAFGPA